MLNHFLKRCVESLVVLFGLSLLAFFLVRAVPGDTATAMLGTNYNQADAEKLREQYGLDKPIVVQYGLWLGQLARGDLGRSVSGQPVSQAIVDALPVTIELLVIGLVMAVGIGIPLGVFAAVRHDRSADTIASFLGLIGVSVPGFWLGTLLILLFALQLRLLPSGHFVPLTQDPIANLRHMLLPGVALGSAVTAVVMRMTRSSLLDTLGQDFLRTAKAKGLAESRVIIKHALRNAMIPVVTVLAIQAGYLFGGSVVIETVFSLNGVGRLALRAIGNRDYPLLQIVILLAGGVFTLMNLLADLAYAWIDPRIRRAA